MNQVDPGIVELHQACEAGDVERVRAIVDLNSAFLGIEYERYLPIQRTIPKQPAVLECLLQKGDDVNRMLPRVHWFTWEDDARQAGLPNWRPIHMASLYGSLEQSVRTVEVLRDFGADLNSPSPLVGYTALHLAAIPNMHAVVRTLVQSGVDVDVRNHDHIPPAVWPTLMDMTPFEPFSGDQETPLMLACGEGMFEAADTLVELGADVNARNAKGFTPLHYAAGGFWGDRERDYCRIVGRLRESGAVVNARDDEGRRPSDIAKTKDYQAIVELLA